MDPGEWRLAAIAKRKKTEPGALPEVVVAGGAGGLPADGVPMQSLQGDDLQGMLQKWAPHLCETPMQQGEDLHCAMDPADMQNASVVQRPAETQYDACLSMDWVSMDREALQRSTALEYVPFDPFGGVEVLDVPSGSEGESMGLLHEEDVKGMLKQWAPHLLDKKMLEGQDLLTAALAWTSTEQALQLLGEGQDRISLDDIPMGMQDAMPENIWFPSEK